MRTWKFYFATFGCKVNQYETQALREAWTALNGEECQSPGLADVICVNSCAITSKGERDARSAVFRLRREAPAARLILTGCAAQLFADFKPRPNAHWAEPDLVLPQESKFRLLAGPWVAAQGGAAPRAFPPFRIGDFARARPVVKVQDGCAHRCTYCIVPFTRGIPTSRPVEDVIQEARTLLQKGYPELVLSGINLSQYGRGAETGDFWSLLQALDTALAPDFHGKARLRISSLEPGQLHARGIDTLLHCRLLCPHLHISLQHGSQAVLRRMGRGHYTPAMLEKSIETLAKHWHPMGLGADILVGFPGETEEDLRLLLDLAERLPLTYAHVFPYSPRPGTAASHFPNQVPQRQKLARAALLREVISRKHEDFLRAQTALPRMQVVLDARPRATTAPAVAAHTPCALHGVNEYYAPCLCRIPAGRGNQQADIRQGLVAARPVGCEDGRLIVEPLE